MQFPPASGKTRSKELLIKLPIRENLIKVCALSVKRDVIFVGPLNACSTVCFGAGSFFFFYPYPKLWSVTMTYTSKCVSCCGEAYYFSKPSYWGKWGKENCIYKEGTYVMAIIPQTDTWRVNFFSPPGPVNNYTSIHRKAPLTFPSENPVLLQFLVCLVF